jgi:hypothetical protein
MANKSGGFAGYAYTGSVIRDCYSTGAPTGTTKGGFIADNDGTVQSSFWDTQTSGIGTSDGGTGKTTAEMKATSTFTDVYWSIEYLDDTLIWAIGSCNDGYPCLLDCTPSCTWTPPPTVTTSAASAIGLYVATLNGLITGLGSGPPVDVWFEYGKVSGGPYTGSTTKQVLNTAIAFHDHIASLDANTIYYFRACIDDGTTVAYGTEESFTTDNLAVTTNAATNQAPHSATLNGTLTDIADAASVEVYFEYGIVTGVYTLESSHETLTTIGTFDIDVAYLNSSDTYYFRAVVTDGTTTSYGAELTFDTLEALGITITLGIIPDSGTEVAINSQSLTLPVIVGTVSLELEDVSQ